MKKLPLFLIALLSFNVSAETTSPWWRVWQTADEVTGTSDRLFTKNERAVLDEYLRSQGVDTAYRDDDRHDDDRDDDHDGSKNDKHKKDKHKNGKKHKDLPPGLQKKVARGGELPPGWQKKVARGEVLERDLYDASRPLPRSILDRLGRSPEGTSIRQIDDRVVRVMDASGLILDVLGGQ